MSTSASLGLLVLRLGVGGYMLTHGLGKLDMLTSGAEFGDPLGIGPNVSLWLVTAAELVGAALVLVGLATRIAALSLVFAMAVAAFVAHGGDPWTMQYAVTAYYAGDLESWASKEPALLYAVPFAALVLTGPGALSLDALLFRRRADAGE